jgi:hypothetical protein
MVSERKQAEGSAVEISKQMIRSDGPKVTYTTHIPERDTNRYLSIDVPPGSLGLTLIITDQKGASVVAIDKHCPLKRLLRVGDIILTINGEYVRHMQQFGVGKDRMRRFVVLRPTSVAPSSISPRQDPVVGTKPVAWSPGGKAAMARMANRQLKRNNPAEINATKVTTANDAANSAPPAAAKTAQEEREKATIATTDTILPPSAADRIQFHQAASRNLFGKTDQHTTARQELLDQIMFYNKKNGLDSIALRGKSLYQIVRVPITNKKEMSRRRFREMCQRSGALDDFMAGWKKVLWRRRRIRRINGDQDDDRKGELSICV